MLTIESESTVQHIRMKLHAIKQVSHIYPETEVNFLVQYSFMVITKKNHLKFNRYLTKNLKFLAFRHEPSDTTKFS